MNGMSDRPIKRAQALLNGFVNDVKVRILIDAGADSRVVNLRLARDLKLDPQNEREESFVGFTGAKRMRVSEAHVKLALGHQVVYAIQLQVLPFGLNPKILGWDFMRSAGARLDAVENSILLPNEERVPLDLGDPSPQSRIFVTCDGPTSIHSTDRCITRYRSSGPRIRTLDHPRTELATNSSIWKRWQGSINRCCKYWTGPDFTGDGNSDCSAGTVWICTDYRISVGSSLSPVPKMAAIGLQ